MTAALALLVQAQPAAPAKSNALAAWALAVALASFALSLANFVSAHRKLGWERRCAGAVSLREPLKRISQVLESGQPSATIAATLWNARHRAYTEVLEDEVEGLADKQLRSILHVVINSLEACRGPSQPSTYDNYNPRTSGSLDPVQLLALGRAQSNVPLAIDRIDLLKRKSTSG